MREAVVTEKGAEVVDRLDAARQRLVGPMMAAWSDQELKDLARLLRKFVDGANEALKG